jgi:hypothetical protein
LAINDGVQALGARYCDTGILTPVGSGILNLTPTAAPTLRTLRTFQFARDRLHEVEFARLLLS